MNTYRGIHPSQFVNIPTDDITGNDSSDKLYHSIGDTRGLGSPLAHIVGWNMGIQAYTVDREKRIRVPVSISNFSARLLDLPSSCSINNHQDCCQESKEQDSGRKN